MKDDKELYTIRQLVAKGYPEEMLRQLSHGDDFSRFGFRSSDKKTATIYINKAKLDRFLEMREDEFALA